MGPQEIQHVQQSFAGIFARKADLAERFYVHLFTRLPEARGMFRGNFVKQKTMLTAMITSCVRNLDDPRTLEDIGVQLAQEHAHLDLGPREAEAAKRALIAALRDVLGAELDPETEFAWASAISRVAGTLTRH
ncbi:MULTISPECIES: globin domain-containing protein [unclassified Leisingera]|uniref:globin domain-containing protein n=1 Tax=unclassified Leisingera TaxID=2614906 RepID=UPI0003015F27|nr:MULTISPECIES: globin domain-containing protein [unclassified Leisingera]KIC24806.1 globin domain protein [Leisingera sp. ANG-S3]KIC28411.1 globin domain protein [Leisingera sp. ANG-M6]KIC31541.1 globin domain protein [Leisingera sp. ANG-S5]KIC55338.1 globin domain protein [Leisingera sp. ANG-S]KID09070.1 globin domain protein [Leisingera sp. ANG1]